MRLPVRIRRDTLRSDAVAGLVLGVQSVPDGLATGLLAGVNPLAGLNAYLIGTVAGAGFTSSAFMAVQATSAMSMIIADVPGVHGAADPARALFTLSILTGVIMLVAGLLRLGFVLRFVSTTVVVGFINAVGVNIVLGQLANFTGYASDASSRITRALDTLIHPGRIDVPTLAVGVSTIVLIVALEHTPIGSLGLVVAVVATSAARRRAGVDERADHLRPRDRARLAPDPGATDAPAGARAPDPRGLARIRRIGPGGRHLGQPAEPRRHVSGAEPRLHRPGRGQRRLGRVPGNAGRGLALGVAAEQGRRRAFPPISAGRRTS